jgi:hypothetical protein
MEYEWQDSFSDKLSKGCPKRLVERVFSRLNNGTMYNDVDGKFVGYITAIEGPLGIIHIMSDHSLDYDNSGFVHIKATYLDRCVLHLLIDRNVLCVYEFNTGWWANKI